MLTVKTHNNSDIDANMTHLQGYLTMEKHALVALFGAPLDHSYDNDKVINEWTLEITDENGDSGVVTIYDWKNYGMGSLGDNYRNWNVGGHKQAALTVLEELLGQTSRPFKVSIR